MAKWPSLRTWFFVGLGLFVISLAGFTGMMLSTSNLWLNQFGVRIVYSRPAELPGGQNRFTHWSAHGRSINVRSQYFPDVHDDMQATIGDPKAGFHRWYPVMGNSPTQKFDFVDPVSGRTFVSSYWNNTLECSFGPNLFVGYDHGKITAGVISEGTSFSPIFARVGAGAWTSLGGDRSDTRHLSVEVNSRGEIQVLGKNPSSLEGKEPLPQDLCASLKWDFPGDVIIPKVSL